MSATLGSSDALFGLASFSALAAVAALFVVVGDPVHLLWVSVFAVTVIFVGSAHIQSATLVTMCASAAALTGIPTFGPTYLFKAIPSLAMCVLAVVVFLRVRNRRNCGRYMWVVPLYIIATILVGATRGEIDAVNAALLQLAAVLPLVMLYPIADRTTVLRFLRFFIAIAVVEALLGIIEVARLSRPAWGYLGDVNEYEKQNQFVQSFDLRGMGTLAHPIPLGMMCAFSIVLLIQLPVFRSRVTTMIAIAVLSAGILASGTRTAALACVAGVIVAVLHMRSSKRLAWTSVLTVFAGVLILWIDIVRILGFSGIEATHSFTHRQDGWRAWPTLFSRPVTHVAMGTSEQERNELEAFSYLNSGFAAVDNAWVSVTLSWGLVGLVSAALVFLVPMLRVRDSRPLIAMLFVFSFSFDLLVWNIGLFVLLVAILAGSWCTAHPGESKANIPDGRVHKRDLEASTC